MVRQIIHIDEDKCNGCGLCASACHEGAIDIVDGKAKLMREHFCDGLGDCLPGCPTGAITFEMREAPEYDEAAVMAAKEEKKDACKTTVTSGCPGAASRAIKREGGYKPLPEVNEVSMPSMLSNWPVQIKLAPIQAPYFDKAKLLVAADCTAYAYAAFHKEFIKDHVCLIGCPKLDSVDYTEKLTEIIRNNDISEVHMVRMEVPCCGGLENATRQAVENSGKGLDLKVTVVGIEGSIVANR